MLNRIRISTTLFLILILCGVLQVGSNGLSFWAFRDGYQNLQEVETSNQQRSALAQTRAVLLQASTALNKAGTLTALSYPPEDIKALMVVARSSLKQADAQFKAFTAQEAVSEKEKALKVAMKKTFDVWYGDLDHQATWLENNQLSDFLTAPVQASQAAFDGSFNAWQQDINQFVARAGADSRTSYRMSGAIFLTMVILAALLTGGSLWWSRKMIVQPLAIVSSHFDSMAKGDLARPVAVYGRNEISAIFASLKAMQGSLRETVSNVRQGSYAMHTGISEIAAGNNDLSSRTEQQAASLAQTAASMEQLTATVSQNAG
jgi:Methyl-accepting chemotaxis protein